MSMHYVANVKVEKVMKTEASGGPLTGKQQSREVTETLNLTFKSNSLDGLKGKIQAHVNLLDEEDL